MKSGVLAGVILVVAVIIIAAAVVFTKFSPSLRTKAYQRAYQSGVASAQSEDYPKAIKELTRAHNLSPKESGPLYYRGCAQFKQQNLDAALQDLTAAIELEERAQKPNDSLLGGAYYIRALANHQHKAYAQSVADYRKALTYEGGLARGKNFVLTNNNLAWMLATCPDPKVQDGKQAVIYAKKACELSNWANEDYLDTLAAAYARAGQYDEAVKTQQKAIALITDSKKKEDFSVRLRLFQQKQAYSEK